MFYEIPPRISYHIVETIKHLPNPTEFQTLFVVVTESGFTHIKTNLLVQFGNMGTTAKS